MTAPSLWGVGAALAFVLGLLVILAYAVRRLGPRTCARGGDGRGDVRVLSRVGLSARQGVATLRVDGRTVLVSYGEGGVRLLLETDCEKGAAGEDGDAGRTTTGEPGAFSAALARAGRRAVGLRTLMLALVLGLGLAGPVSGAALASTSMPLQTLQRSDRQASPAATREVAGREANLARKATGAGMSLPRMSLDLGGGDGEGLRLSGPVGTVVFVGFLTLIPTLLLLTTAFTRILIVLQLLKQALGTQTAPPAHLLAAMALLLTGFVMAPTFEQVNRTALAPWMDGRIDEGQMIAAAAVPVRRFMLSTTREKDLRTFLDMRQAPPPANMDEIPFVVLTSAFVTSELTRAFQMGFALFLPFVVIDVVVASVLMSMGMFMLPPVMVSLPFKLLLFVLVDGWSLVVSSLVRSF